jgi:hypothetical protein
MLQGRHGFHSLHAGLSQPPKVSAQTEAAPQKTPLYIESGGGPILKPVGWGLVPAYKEIAVWLNNLKVQKAPKGKAQHKFGSPTVRTDGLQVRKVHSKSCHGNEDSGVAKERR